MGPATSGRSDHHGGSCGRPARSLADIWRGELSEDSTGVGRSSLGNSGFLGRARSILRVLERVGKIHGDGPGDLGGSQPVQA